MGGTHHQGARAGRLLRHDGVHACRHGLGPWRVLLPGGGPAQAVPRDGKPRGHGAGRREAVRVGQREGGCEGGPGREWGCAGQGGTAAVRAVPGPGREARDAGRRAARVRGRRGKASRREIAIRDPESRGAEGGWGPRTAFVPEEVVLNPDGCRRGVAGRYRTISGAVTCWVLAVIEVALRNNRSR